MHFTRPVANRSIWRSKPDVVRQQASEVKSDLDRLLNESTDALITVIGELESPQGSEGIGTKLGRTLASAVLSDDVALVRVNADKGLEYSRDGARFENVASAGHIIHDRHGNEAPQRSRLRFVNSEVTDENDMTVVTGVRGESAFETAVRGGYAESDEVFAAQLAAMPRYARRPDGMCAAGSFAALDGAGNLLDSGAKPADFALSGHGHTAEYAAVLTADGWSAGTPCEQTVSVGGMTAQTRGVISIARDASDTAFVEASGGLLRVSAQGEGTLTVRAHGARPAVDVPIVVLTV